MAKRIAYQLNFEKDITETLAMIITIAGNKSSTKINTASFNKGTPNFPIL